MSSTKIAPLKREKNVKFTSNNNRKQIVEFFQKGIPPRQIACLMNIKKPTVNNIIREFKKTGKLETTVKFNHRPRFMKKKFLFSEDLKDQFLFLNYKRKLTDSQQKQIKQWVDEERNLTLKEICQKCYDNFDVQVSVQTVSRIVAKLNGKTPKLLEVCVDSIESALAAAQVNRNGSQAQVTRIELCSALSEGVLTPTLGTFIQLKKMINTKRTQIFVMLRPRRGTDFNYSKFEIESILLDLAEFKKHGADGFVFGALDNDGQLDEASCSQVVQAAGDLPCTFHRAFDVLKEEHIQQHTETIIKLGFRRILTSGLNKTAEKGLQMIKFLNLKFGDRIIIMPGAGITSVNLGKIILESSCTEFHSSCREAKQIDINPQIMDLTSNHITDVKVVKKLLDILKNF